MREAEAYRAQMTGEPMADHLAPPAEPEVRLETTMQRYSDAAPSPAARRWFHAGRALAEAQFDEEGGPLERSLGSASAEGEQLSVAHDDLRRAIVELSPEDALVVLALVRRLAPKS